jgi:hypothetical protein
MAGLDPKKEGAEERSDATLVCTVDRKSSACAKGACSESGVGRQSHTVIGKAY